MITEILGIDVPLIQAPMAGVQDSELAIAVCQAGALGSLPCATYSPDKLAEQLDLLRQGTHLPVNLNFFCHSPPPEKDGRQQSWYQALAPYYRELGINPLPPQKSSPRKPFDADTLAVLKSFAPAVVSFHFGLPEPALLDPLKAMGACIVSSATTVSEAQWLASRGADMVIAQGLEAGGHRAMFLTEDISTQMGIMSLLPRILDAVNLPVIAAGGLSDARSVKAALTMGAAGVQSGTAFLLCHEARTSAVHRAALQSEEAVHTALTNLFSGRPARSIVNRLMREMGPMSEQVPAFPTAGEALLPLRRITEAQGAGDFMPLWSGQRADAARVCSAAEVVKALTSLI